MKKKYNLKSWFTLIELMIVISIMGMISMMFYAPFSHYQKKQRVINSAKIISQVLNDSRNSAIYWMASSTWNLDVWVLLKKGEEKIYIVKYAYKEWDIPVDYSDISKYSTEMIPLEKWIQITSEDWLFAFKAITGSWIYKNISVTDNKTEISVWMWNVTTWPLTRKIIYYTKTYISDVVK